MIPTPTKFKLVAGTAEGPTRLNAFDNALLAAGVGNLNLLKVSSILPPKAEYKEDLEIPPGSLTPVAYGCSTSDVPGELISAGVAVGFSDQGRDSYGVIMEFSGKCSREEAEKRLTQMVRDAFAARGLEVKKMLIKACEHNVKQIGCAFAAVALWY